MVFVGMDHGTTGISFAILDSDGKVLDVLKFLVKIVKQVKLKH